MLYLGVSDNHDAQLNILKALTRKFRLDPGLDLKDIADQCPFNYTGADFYALCSDAMLKSMARKAQEIDDRIGLSRNTPGYWESMLMLPSSGAQRTASAILTSTSSNATVLSCRDGDV